VGAAGPLRPLSTRCGRYLGVVHGEAAATGRAIAEGRRDVGYTGHSIENVGSGPARILATNFDQPAELFGKFADRDVIIVPKDGPVGESALCVPENPPDLAGNRISGVQAQV